MKTVADEDLRNCFWIFIQSYNKKIGVTQARIAEELNKEKFIDLFQYEITTENIIPSKII